MDKNINIKEELKAIAPFLSSLDKPDWGVVPADYFDGLEERLFQRIEVMEELEEVSPLLSGLPKDQRDSCPKDYFEDFESRLLQKIEQEEELEELAPLLSSLPKAQKGNYPEDYFEDFESRLLQKIEQEEELEKVAPMLSKFDKVELGTTPEGYFEQFEQQLDQELQAEANEKVIPLKPKAWWTKSYAVMGIAASFLLLVAVGVWIFRLQNEELNPYKQIMAMDIQEEIRNLPLAEADDFVLQHIDDISTEALMEGMNQEELEALAEAQTAAIIDIPLDTVPPVIKTPSKEDKNKTVPQKQISETDDLGEELETEIIDETDFEDLATDLTDDDFAALEAALLGKKTEKKNSKDKKEPKK